MNNEYLERSYELEFDFEGKLFASSQKRAVPFHTGKLTRNDSITDPKEALSIYHQLKEKGIGARLIRYEMPKNITLPNTREEITLSELEKDILEFKESK